MTDLFAKIDKNEKYMMDWMRENFAIDEANSHNEANLEYVMRIWNEAKQNLYTLLDNQLIYHQHIAYTEDMQDIQRRLNKLYHQEMAYRHFTDAWSVFFRNKYRDYSLDEDLRAWYSVVQDLIDDDNLALNMYRGNTFKIPNPKDADKPINVQKGCKISKVIGKIAAAYDIAGFEEFRILHSQALNQKKLEGNLCLSIHPLDFMTSSYNNCGWSSCMNWDGGEYRLGTVEMMNSPVVICAYLASSTDTLSMGYYDGERQSWNSKKWRQYFIVDKDIIAGIKGYPYWNKGLEQTVIGILRDLAEKNLGYGPYAKNIVEYDTEDMTSCPELSSETYDIGFDTGFMYNDFYSDYTYSICISSTAPHCIRIYYSGAAECMVCGNTNCDFSDANVLYCYDCDKGIYCANCGERIYEDDAYYVDGEYYCEYCYNDMPCCEGCDEVHTEDNMTYIYVVDKSDLTKDEFCQHRYDYLCINLCDNCMWRYNIHDKRFMIRYNWQDFTCVEAKDLPQELIDSLDLGRQEQSVEGVYAYYADLFAK